MANSKGGDTVNKGPAPQQRPEDSDEFDITGNARVRGENPSPDDRERGEISIADAEPASADQR